MKHHHNNELDTMMWEKHYIGNKSLRDYKKAAHKEDRRNGKEIIREELEAVDLTD